MENLAPCMLLRKEGIPWFNVATAAKEDFERKLTPLHYNINKLDFVGALEELHKGANPRFKDSCGRTVLDLLVSQFINTVQNIFCISTPLDFLNIKINVDNQHVLPHYFRFIGTSNNSRSNNDNFGRICCRMDTLRSRWYPGMLYFNSISACNSCRDGTDTRMLKNELEKDFSEGFQVQFLLPERQIETCKANFSNNINHLSNIMKTPSKKNGGIAVNAKIQDLTSTGGNTLFATHEDVPVPIDNDVILIVERILKNESGSLKRIIYRLNDLVRQLRAGCRLARILSKYEELRKQAEDLSNIFNHPLGYPYCFKILLHAVYRVHVQSIGYNRASMFPSEVYANSDNYHAEAADMFSTSAKGEVDNALDAQQLIKWIIRRKLMGYELFEAMTIATDELAALVSAIGSRVLHFNSKQAAQNWLLAAFVLRNSDLFQHIVATSYIFSTDFLTPWHHTLHYLISRLKYHSHSPFLKPLLFAFLRSRLQKRLIRENVSASSNGFGNVHLPFEERSLKSDLIDIIREIYGRADAEDLENILKSWKYNAYRKL